MLAEAREVADGPLGAWGVTGGAEEDVESALAQKPTRCACEASER